MYRALVIFVLTFLAATSIVRANDLRKESVGNVEGVLSAPHGRMKDGQWYMTLDENTYPLFLAPYIRAGGFEAEMPMQVFLSRNNGSNCPTFFLDSDYSLDAVKRFAQKYHGANVRLYDVHQVYSNNRRLYCTFKAFDVLATRDELAQAREATREKAEQERTSFVFEGDVDADVAPIMLRPRTVGVVRINEGKLTFAEWSRYCGKVASIKPAMDVTRVRQVRQQLQQSARKARLINLKIAEGKCTVSDVIPVPK